MTDPKILDRAKQWLTPAYDQATRDAVNKLIEEDSTELTDAFYRDLEFGTGGLRGIMGPGTNRMNKYTVGKATQGLANYLLKTFVGDETIKVAIAYDCRINNTFFSDITAAVLSANGITVYI
ncbi:MAG: phospho-sugar mutase, partial [Bacteroidales bacterium]|nr:phospho-sugar mutase [Bacteroidales bacterium]